VAVSGDLPEIPFNRAANVGSEAREVAAAIDRGHLAADGPRTAWCAQWLEALLGSPVLLVHSCTAALEMAAILADIGPGDEVIMPSYTFVSTANAFVLRGATPVFVDVEAGTLNIDPALIEKAITDRTKAIVPVHYAGVGCDMSPIQALAADHGLILIEDAAQGLLASRGGVPLGTFGELGALSFHETKNVTCGEGGALIVNDPRFFQRAEIIREKGTDRSRFFRGEVDKYTWVDVGSSYAMSEVSAAFLSAQLEQAEALTRRRISIWERYHEALAELESYGYLQRPLIPENCRHNAHMYAVRMPSRESRDRMIRLLRERSISAVFHYVPLHDSPAGRRYGRVVGPMTVTNSVAGRLLRLPLWSEMSESQTTRVIDAVKELAPE
jgi:dTDP-4-amino-4,6-dideoxygalactose transaminase